MLVNFRSNVSVTIFLVSSTFQDILNGCASFSGQKDTHKNCSAVHYFVPEFSFHVEKLTKYERYLSLSKLSN